jgi:hypothetical protein
LDELSVIALKKLADACGNHCLLIIASAESFLPTDEQAIKLFFHQSVIVLWIKKPLKRHGLTVCIIHSVKDVLVSYEKRYLLGRMKRSMRHGCAWLWMTIRRCCQFNLNHYALIAAYTHGESWLESLLGYLRENVAYLVRACDALDDICVVKPEGTYLAWMDFRRTGLSEDQVTQLLCQRAGIGLERGSVFGDAGIGFQRLNFATSRRTLSYGVDHMVCALRG